MEKTVECTVHKYVTQNGRASGKRLSQGSTARVLDFLYDNMGKPYALKNSTDGGSSFKTYYYVLNLQGDVVALMDKGEKENIKTECEGKVNTKT